MKLIEKKYQILILLLGKKNKCSWTQGKKNVYTSSKPLYKSHCYHMSSQLMAHFPSGIFFKHWYLPPT